MVLILDLGARYGGHDDNETCITFAQTRPARRALDGNVAAHAQTGKPG
jgi:hypothetical protein